MTESSALLVDDVFPEEPVQQWVLSVKYPLRFHFASRPEIMGHVLGIVYRCIATHLSLPKSLFRCQTAFQISTIPIIQYLRPLVGTRDGDGRVASTYSAHRWLYAIVEVHHFC